MRGELTTAAPFIGVAVVLDMLDGRIARMTGTSSDFGVQLDSLADLISFGMAPAILAFQWGLSPLGRLGWAVGFVYLTAAALRLARFNIQQVSDKRYFVGLPSPAAAGIPAATVFYLPGRPARLSACLVCGGDDARARAADGQHDSLPQLQEHRPGDAARLPGLILVAGFLALIVTFPHEVLIVMAYTYLASAFVGLAISRFRRAPAEREPTGT